MSNIIRIDLSTPNLDNLGERARLLAIIHAEIRSKLRELSRAHYLLYPDLAPTIYSDRLDEIVCVSYANTVHENEDNPAISTLPHDHELCAEYRTILGTV